MRKFLGYIALMVTAAALLALSGHAQTTKTNVSPDVVNTAVKAYPVFQNQFNDPDSLVIEQVFFTQNKPNKQTFCFRYRARNGFGGMNRGSTIYHVEYKKNGKVKTGWDDVDRYALPQSELRQGIVNQCGGDVNITKAFKKALSQQQAAN